MEPRGRGPLDGAVLGVHLKGQFEGEVFIEPPEHEGWILEAPDPVTIRLGEATEAVIHASFPNG